VEERANGRRRPLAAWGIAAAVLLFVALELPAMALYPGGTWWDPHTQGARFWQNFLCDLEWRVALDGVPNPVGSRLAQAAMVVLVLGLLPLWWTVPRVAGEPRLLGGMVRVLGAVSVAGTLAVAFMPSDRFGSLHGTVVVAAALPGLTAAVLAVALLLRGEPAPRVAGALGAAMLAASVADFVLYARHLLAGGGPGPLVLPAAQKVALLLLLAWMLAVAARSRYSAAAEGRRRARPTSGAPSR
jgi:hypothetical protein